MKCPRCQHENSAQASFCMACGAGLSAREKRGKVGAVPGRKPPTNEGVQNPDLEKRLAEALEREAEALRRESAVLQQQTATADVLRIMSASRTDIQPVFDAIATRAAHLCSAVVAVVLRLIGDELHLVAHWNTNPEWIDVARREYPIPTAEGISGLALAERRAVHVPDIDADERFPFARRLARTMGYRSIVFVPMLHDGVAVGTIGVGARAPFSESQIAVLQTFAAQAVIAIENVRLFKELQEKNRALTEAHAQVTEALQHQTATSEILQVISRSPTDVQPVFDTIIQSAVRLLGGFSGLVAQIIGDEVHLAALTSTNPSGDAAQKALWPRPVKEDVSVHGHVIASLAPYFITNVESDRSVPPSELAVARARGWRSIVAVPLLRDGRAIGSLAVTRSAPGGFAEGQVALLQTFADQAVIAIENVRLFKELEEKNRALTQAHAQVSESLEQQTATSDLLKVIGRSTFDLQPVFETLIENAVRLCGAEHGVIRRFDGERLRAAAQYNTSPELEAYVQENPIAPERGSAAGRAALERRTIHIEDALSDPEYTFGAQHLVAPIRTVLAIPMVRSGELLGVITIHRHEARAFDDSQISLVETFADQAAIAIENARLLGELRKRTAELSRSVEELTALAEVSRALSSTLNLDTVLATIVARAIQLSGTEAGTIWEYDATEEVFHLRAAQNLEDDIVGVLRATPLRRGEGTVGRLADTRAPLQIGDISEETAYRGRLEVIVRSGYRAILSVPLLREDQLIGALTVNAKTPREFPSAVVDLLTTFATQSALAIQNARLFRELAEKSHQLEVASQHKSEFLANMSHELRTPLNAVIGFSEVLSERMFGELNEKQDEYLKDIHASGQHLLSLINDILDLSKIEAGKMELELSDFDLPMTIDNALMLVRERAARRGIEVHRTLDERLGQIQADERKIRQVLLNLLSNAIKFTPEGGRIDVQARPVDGLIEISVSDTGVGIAPEDQQAVFEEFRQVGTADKKVGGTGLGLALSRKFIELHGGRIWVKSAVGMGSTFTFTIPVRRGE